MPNTIEINVTAEDLAAEAKVNAYVNVRTGTGSPEAALQALVREAVGEGVDYLRTGTEQTSFSGEHDDEHYGKALGLAQAVKIATRGEITDTDVIGSARVVYVEENA